MTTENAEQTRPFIPLTDTESLDELFRRSNDSPVIFFKHSSTCPISSAVYQEMERLTSEVAIIVVQLSPDISRELERRTGLRHQSPQVIILRNGAAIWNASHWAINADAVTRAIGENA